ncbi:MAG TPA: hypothetical protein VFU49_09670 [Ktedonobacteraceae bacterium]|nr:hypothetical protein [Ktedonobacteraceae bacterium]
MDSFDNLYCGKIQYLQVIDDRLPVHGVGNISTYYLLRDIHSVTTVMLMIVDKDKVPLKDIESGKVIPVMEALQARPRALEDAMLSWVVFPEDSRPTALLIHNGISTDDFKQLCYSHLWSNVPLKDMSDLALKKVKEQVDRATLTDPTNIKRLVTTLLIDGEEQQS